MALQPGLYTRSRFLGRHTAPSAHSALTARDHLLLSLAPIRGRASRT